MRKYLLSGLASCLFLIGAGNMQGAEIVSFAWTGMSGYTAVGDFIFDPATTPTMFSESGSGQLQYVQSFSISFFDPSHTVLETGSSVTGGVSSDRFFRLTYDTQARIISSLDADIGGASYQYFLTNLRTPTGDVVGPGVTTFNFFYRPNADAALDIATAVQVTSVTQTPEPASFALVLVASLSVLSVFLLRKSHQS